MSEPESPRQDPAQGHACNRAILHRAIEAYERAWKLHRQITTMITERYTDHVPDLPRERLEQKLTGDVLLVQESLSILGHSAQTLIEIARKLEGYIPSGDTGT
jgi:hypothetical protein